MGGRQSQIAGALPRNAINQKKKKIPRQWWKSVRGRGRVLLFLVVSFTDVQSESGRRTLSTTKKHRCTIYKYRLKNNKKKITITLLRRPKPVQIGHQAVVVVILYADEKAKPVVSHPAGPVVVGGERRHSERILLEISAKDAYFIRRIISDRSLPSDRPRPWKSNKRPRPQQRAPRPKTASAWKPNIPRTRCSSPNRHRWVSTPKNNILTVNNNHHHNGTCARNGFKQLFFFINYLICVYFLPGYTTVIWVLSIALGT